MTPLKGFLPRDNGSATWRWEHADKKAAHTVLWDLLDLGFFYSSVTLKKDTWIKYDSLVLIDLVILENLFSFSGLRF